MTIYIEEFLIENILINFCLLKLIHSTTKCNTSFFKLLLASIIGSSTSIVVTMFLQNVIVINLLKAITAMVMTIVAYKQDAKHFVLNFILLFVYTYMFGGIVTSLNFNLVLSSFGLIAINQFGLEIVCIVILIATYIFDLAVRNLKTRFSINKFVYPVTLQHNNNTLTINAYLDTGNLLNVNGKPVIVLDINAYLKLSNTDLIHFYLTKSDEIKANTVVGNNNLKLFTIDKIKIKTDKKILEFKNQLIAVNTNNSFKNTNYQALLSPLIL